MNDPPLSGQQFGGSNVSFVGGICRPNLVLPALHLDRPLAGEPAVRLTVYGESAKSEVWSVAFDRVASKFHVPRE
jgi:hypothetical protein